MAGKTETKCRNAVPEGNDRARILYLEDEFLVALSFGDALRRMGVGEVLTASSLEEANQIIDANRIDAAILDVNIDGQPSFAVADRIRQAGGQVIFATGYDRERAGLGDRDDEMLRKPYTESDLRSALDRALA